MLLYEVVEHTLRTIFREVFYKCINLLNSAINLIISANDKEKKTIVGVTTIAPDWQKTSLLPKYTLY